MEAIHPMNADTRCCFLVFHQAHIAVALPAISFLSFLFLYSMQRLGGHRLLGFYSTWKVFILHHRKEVVKVA